ncbi:MAG: hypothetical protein LBI82_07535 [Dysgonamonadaceae bacterium]|jgi:hypothetical protein|nr:hypothetical protein [Dysgonamonadaceae bacterium]
MKKTVVVLLSICMFESCMKDETLNVGNVVYYEGAAIVKDSKAEKPILEVLHDIVLVAPGLAGKGLDNGDLLWTKLVIEKDKQTNKDTIFVSDIVFNRIDNSLAKPATEIASEFTCPIDRAVMWRNHAKNIWVFGFEQMAPQVQIFDYEMQFDKKDGDTYPTVYLRSQKSNTVAGTDKRIVSGFGFDLTPLIEKYGDEETNTLTFHVKYLSGFDKDKKKFHLFPAKSDNSKST